LAFAASAAGAAGAAGGSAAAVVSLVVSASAMMLGVFSFEPRMIIATKFRQIFFSSDLNAGIRGRLKK
jgi:hypothetical protein